jgi:hypothetical protein
VFTCDTEPAYRYGGHCYGPDEFDTEPCDCPARELRAAMHALVSAMRDDGIAHPWSEPVTLACVFADLSRLLGVEPPVAATRLAAA